MNQSGILQNQIKFTVEIKTLDKECTVGTGIAIRSDLVITCSHVAEYALGVSLKDAGDSQIVICFPGKSEEEAVFRYAVVDSYFKETEDDIVSLRLIGETAPLEPDQFAIIGSTGNIMGHRFVSYGFSPIGDFLATWAQGIISEGIPFAISKKVHEKPIQLDAENIDRGMSGASVLDMEQNLIIGLVSDRYFTNGFVKRNVAYAVNAAVLTRAPFSLPYRKEPHPLGSAPEPRIKVNEVVSGRLNPCWNNAPSILPKWVGRKELLEAMTKDWLNPKKRIVSLVGFGGEGKSSLARHWIEDLIKDKNETQPSGIFWWDFSGKPNVDQFFEAAIKYISSGVESLSNCLSSSSAKSQFLAGMLYLGNYIIILDGLENLQHLERSHYGQLTNNDLLQFIEFFTKEKCKSLLLITSRISLSDLMNATSYQQYNVERLNDTECRLLLKQFHINGSIEDIDQLLSNSEGHALTLTLLAGIILNQYDGKIEPIKCSPFLASGDGPLAPINRILEYYSNILSKEELSFLSIFGFFRLPVEDSAFSEVFRKEMAFAGDAPNKKLALMNNEQFKKMIDYLSSIFILKYNNNAYFIHTLIRDYFVKKTSYAQYQIISIHNCIKNYYLNKYKNTMIIESLEDLSFGMEAIYHACKASDYDEGWKIFTKGIDKDKSTIKTQLGKLGAYETKMSIYREFLGGNLGDTVPFTNSKWEADLLEDVGFAEMSLGNFPTALKYYNKSIEIYHSLNNWVSISRCYQDLARLNIYSGNLRYALDASNSAIEYGKRIHDYKHDSPQDLRRLEHLRNSHCLLAYSYYLMGLNAEANFEFNKAIDCHKEIHENTSDYKEKNYLQGYRGAMFAEYLIKKGDLKEARNIINANLGVIGKKKDLVHKSRCYRILGEINGKGLSIKQQKDAKNYFDLALEIAESTFRKDILIESLKARGEWEIKNAFGELSLKDLEDALSYAKSGGYLIYEAEILVALAMGHVKTGDISKGKAEVMDALQISQINGYYWVQNSSTALLDIINKNS